MIITNYQILNIFEISNGDKMLGNFSNIKSLFEQINNLPKLDKNYVIAFVFNSSETMDDNLHASECIFPEERYMIQTAFERVAENVFCFDCEDNFLKSAEYLKSEYKYVLVYSMAQNVNGRGRRSLIPLLCDYYKFINIGGNLIGSFLGRSKDLMYLILSPMGFRFPLTHYIKSVDDIYTTTNQITSGIWLLKPNNESSSIGLKKYDFSMYTKKNIKEALLEYMKKYPVFCVQEFIEGEEVAVPILKIKNDYYCPAISQVDFPLGKTYIDYDMILLETYSFLEYEGEIKEELINIAVKVAQTLGMSSMSRIDFRIKNNIPYIEDIGANPTISEANGVNQLYCKYLNAEPWCIYGILVYAALIEANLFEPPFH